MTTINVTQPTGGSLWQHGKLQVAVLAVTDDQMVVWQKPSMTTHVTPLAHWYRQFTPTGWDSSAFDLVPVVGMMPKAVMLFAQERRRQISEKGYTPEVDDSHGPVALAGAALNYVYAAMEVLAGGEAMPEPVLDSAWPKLPSGEPWPYKPKGVEQDLVRAGALLMAQLDKCQRAKVRAVTGQVQ